MSQIYSEKKVKEELKKGLETIDNLYNCKCVNWKGATNSKKYYSEIIADELLKDENLKLLENIKQIKREEYKVKSHFSKNKINETNRKEEILAKKLYLTEINKLGYVIDYQIPLKKEKSDKAGKIDLITRQNESVYIVELKYLGNGDTLLKTILEIETYFRQLNKENFIKSYQELENIKPTNIEKAVLLGLGSNAYKEAKELNQRPNLKTLIQKIKIKVFLLDKISEIS